MSPFFWVGVYAQTDAFFEYVSKSFEASSSDESSNTNCDTEFSRKKNGSKRKVVCLGYADLPNFSFCLEVSLNSANCSCCCSQSSKVDCSHAPKVSSFNASYSSSFSYPSSSSGKRGSPF